MPGNQPVCSGTAAKVLEWRPGSVLSLPLRFACAAPGEVCDGARAAVLRRRCYMSLWKTAYTHRARQWARE